MAAFLALAVLVAVLAVVVFGLLTRLSKALEHIEQTTVGGGPNLGTPPGADLPSFDVRAGDGRVLRLPADQAGPFVLLLIEPGCPPCEQVAAEVSARGWDLPEVALLTVLPAEDPQSVELAAAAGPQVVYQSGGAASAAVGATVSPIAFAVNEAGVVIERIIPSGMEDLVGLALQARGDRGHEVSVQFWS